MASVNRRKFLGTAAAVGSSAFLGAAPRGSLFSQRRIAVGCVGTGNRGETNCIVMVGQDVKALCDVDEKFLTPMLSRYPSSKPFVDWREMLEKTELEAVLISTPDHLHAPIALAAMKKGLHVYIEKPLAPSISEVRQIEAVAKEKGLVAWMGNQHHVAAGYRRAIELLQSNTIGLIKEVHAWTNRPTWAQGIQRPLDGAPVPPNLNWDLWLGPAPQRDYNPIYHPVGWRGWWDFGGGALADMGPHLLDPVFTGLALAAPMSIMAETSGDGSAEVAPSWSRVKFDFAARGDKPAVAVHWYDGETNKPPREIVGSMRLPMNGVMCIGELGKVFIPDLGRSPLVIPNMRGEPLVEPEGKVSLTRGNQQDWLDACRDDKPNHEQFVEACRLTEMCLAGNVAIRLCKNTKEENGKLSGKLAKPLQWDPATGQFNFPSANKLLTRTYRKGWELPG